MIRESLVREVNWRWGGGVGREAGVKESQLRESGRITW